MSSVRDAAVVRAFRRECGIVHAVLTGLSESTYHMRLVLDPSSSPNFSNPRCASKRLSRHHLTEWRVGPTQIFLAISCRFRHK